jgi:hypothetical protein
MILTATLRPIMGRPGRHELCAGDWNMKSYFQRVEPGNTLDLTTYPTQAGYMPAWMKGN